MRDSEHCRPKTILLVDDYGDFLYMIAEIWKKSPAITVATAANGLEALEYLRKNPPPDLIVTDLEMPVLDGFGLYQQLKGNEDWSTIAIVVLSSRILSEKELSFFKGTPHLQKGGTSLEMIKQTVEMLLFG